MTKWKMKKFIVDSHADYNFRKYVDANWEKMKKKELEEIYILCYEAEKNYEDWQRGGLVY